MLVTIPSLEINRKNVTLHHQSYCQLEKSRLGYCLLAITNNLHKNDENRAIRTEALPLSETDKLRFAVAAKISCFFFFPITLQNKRVLIQSTSMRF